MHHQKRRKYPMSIRGEDGENDQDDGVRFQESEEAHHRSFNDEEKERSSGHHNHHGERHHHHSKVKHKMKSNGNKNPHTKKNTSHHNGQHGRLSSSTSSDSNERIRRYLYSAISATFFFVLFREIGWIDSMQDALVDAAQRQFVSKINLDHPQDSVHTHGSAESLVSVAANMAGATSARLGSGGNAPKKRADGFIDTTITTPSTGHDGMMDGKLLGNSKNFLSQKEIMDHVKEQDPSIVPGSRPIMYTFFEWIAPRNRGTSMSDVGDKALITKWKEAWKAAGWHPIVLTLEDSKRHENYQQYSSQLSKIPMNGMVAPDDGGASGSASAGTVVYNQLCFLRWLAVAAAGGGWMCDYDVFPLAAAPERGQDEISSQLPLVPPNHGNFTVYCRIKNSRNAGIPCLMSGRADEWTRMANAILENGIQNAGNGESMWSDMLALIDLRNHNMYRVYDAVLEGQEVLLKHGWTSADCGRTKGKEAVHFSHEALKLGYLRPGESTEHRADIISRFLTSWNHLCGNGPREEKSVVLFGDAATDKGNR